MTNQNDNKDEDGGTDWTIPALSAAIAGVAGYYFKPFGGAFESAGLLASIAIISFSIREYIVRNRK